jgi:hypothetical protein
VLASIERDDLDEITCLAQEGDRLLKHLRPLLESIAPLAPDSPAAATRRPPRSPASARRAAACAPSGSVAIPMPDRRSTARPDPTRPMGDQAIADSGLTLTSHQVRRATRWPTAWRARRTSPVSTRVSFVTTKPPIRWETCERKEGKSH